jgi:hypothetical protein
VALVHTTGEDSIDARTGNGVTTHCNTFLWRSDARREAWCNYASRSGEFGQKIAEWRLCETMGRHNLTKDPTKVTCLYCLVEVACP